MLSTISWMEITLDGTVDSQLAHVHLENFYIAPPKDTYQHTWISWNQQPNQNYMKSRVAFPFQWPPNGMNWRPQWLYFYSLASGPNCQPQRTQTIYTQSGQDQMLAISSVPHLFPPFQTWDCWAHRYPPLPQRTQTGYTQSRQDQMPGIGHVLHLFSPEDLSLVGTRLSSIALPLHSAPPIPFQPPR